MNSPSTRITIKLLLGVELILIFEFNIFIKNVKKRLSNEKQTKIILSIS